MASGDFEIAVIGLGLIGSAAARHLSLNLGPSLLAIGPSHSLVCHPPFSSHSDQGRLTRIVDPDPVWSLLAARSIAQYPSLQHQSGISFHYPSGFIRVSPSLDQPNDSLRSSFLVGQANGAVAEIIESPSVLQLSFPCFYFRLDESAVLESGGAGFINPRELIDAQLAVAEKNGAYILRETVTRILPAGEGVQIFTQRGKTLLAQKALVCAGSYSGFLLPNKNLDLNTKAVSIVLAEVRSEKEQRILRDMPSFIWKLKAHKFLHSVYGCPPIQYPDGKFYVKIGGTAWEPIYLSSSEEISQWFNGHGNPQEIQALREVLGKLLPDLRPSSFASKPCMVSYTAHGYPYIDAADGKPTGCSRIFVAAGGCGASAKSADEIGKIAALLVKNGKWVYDLDASIFRAVYTNEVAQAKL